MIRIGTSHFVTYDAALDYYCGPVVKVRTRDRIEGTPFFTDFYWTATRNGGMGYAPANVDDLIKDGSISIGAPVCPAGSTLAIIKDEGRYAFDTPERVDHDAA